MGWCSPSSSKPFPGLPSYECFIALKPRIFMPRLMFLVGRSGRKSGIYYVDSSALAVCHNRRIMRHKMFAGLAARGKTSMDWFFAFKLYLMFNHEHELVALKLTPGNVSGPTPVISLVKGLTGKLFDDKGYIGNKLADTLLRQGLALMTMVHKNMKSLPMTLADKILLKARNMAETILGHIKAFSSLNLPNIVAPSTPSFTSLPHSPPTSSIPSSRTVLELHSSLNP
jgi:hypothetical protein